MEQANARLVGTGKLVSASSTSSKGDRNEAPTVSALLVFSLIQKRAESTSRIGYRGRKILSVGARRRRNRLRRLIRFLPTLADTRLAVTSDPSHRNLIDPELWQGPGLWGQFQDDQITLLALPTLLNGKIRLRRAIRKRLA